MSYVDSISTSTDQNAFGDDYTQKLPFWYVYHQAFPTGTTSGFEEALGGFIDANPTFDPTEYPSIYGNDYWQGEFLNHISNVVTVAPNFASIGSSTLQEYLRLEFLAKANYGTEQQMLQLKESTEVSSDIISSLNDITTLFSKKGDDTDDVDGINITLDTGYRFKGVFVQREQLYSPEYWPTLWNSIVSAVGSLFGNEDKMGDLYNYNHYYNPITGEKEARPGFKGTTLMWTTSESDDIRDGVHIYIPTDKEWDIITNAIELVKTTGGTIGDLMDMGYLQDTNGNAKFSTRMQANIDVYLDETKVVNGTTTYYKSTNSIPLNIAAEGVNIMEDTFGFWKLDDYVRMAIMYAEKGVLDGGKIAHTIALPHEAAEFSSFAQEALLNSPLLNAGSFSNATGNVVQLDLEEDPNGRAAVKVADEKMLSVLTKIGVTNPDDHTVQWAVADDQQEGVAFTITVGSNLILGDIIRQESEAVRLTKQDQVYTPPGLMTLRQNLVDIQSKLENLSTDSGSKYSLSQQIGDVVNSLPDSTELGDWQEWQDNDYNGDVLRHAITASNNLNAVVTNEVKKGMFVLDEFYQSASSLVRKIHSSLRSIAKNIKS